MSEHRRQRLGEIIDQAMRRPAPERQAFLLGACLDDAALAEEARSLLSAVEQAGGVLDRPTLRPSLHPNGAGRTGTEPAPFAPTEGPGTVIGRYKLLQQIGEGG